MLIAVARVILQTIGPPSSLNLDGEGVAVKRLLISRPLAPREPML
jgi:hypothetical protein